MVLYWFSDCHVTKSQPTLLIIRSSHKTTLLFSCPVKKKEKLYLFEGATRHLIAMQCEWHLCIELRKWTSRLILTRSQLKMSAEARSARADEDACRGLGVGGCCAGAGILRITPLQGLIVTPNHLWKWLHLSSTCWPGGLQPLCLRADLHRIPLPSHQPPPTAWPNSKGGNFVSPPAHCAVIFNLHYTINLYF